MIRINVASKIEYKSNQIEVLRPLVLLLVFCGLGYYLPIYYADLKNAEAEGIRAKINEKTSQLEKLKVDVEEVQKLQARLGELKTRAAKIRSLSAGRKQPVFFLDTLQQQHLERMWLSEVAYDGELVSVRGLALDHAVIAEYLRRLKLLGGGQDGSGSDLKEFVPPFLREEPTAREEATGAAAVAPLRLSDVKIVKSTAQSQQETLIQQFSITLNANLK